MPPAKWRQGEHLFIAGDTGSGKTYLESKILVLRDHVMVCRVKPDDIVFDGFAKIDSLKKLGYRRFGNDGRRINRFLLHPEYNRQQFEIGTFLEKAYKDGGWTVAIDEAYYATQILKLERPINKLLTQGRSKKISVVIGVQRPAWISRFAISQATHAFIFRVEGRDLKALSDALSPTVVKPIQDLREHDFIYFNRATRQVIKGNANNLKEVIIRG